MISVCYVVARVPRGKGPSRAISWVPVFHLFFTGDGSPQAAHGEGNQSQARYFVRTSGMVPVNCLLWLELYSGPMRLPWLQVLFLLSIVRRKRNDSVPVSIMCARSVIRSNSALQSRGFGNTVVHSENGKLVVIMSADRSARSEITWNKNSAPMSASGT